MGRGTAKDTAALIEEVARGDRLLEDIKDPNLRETVRLALRLHKDPYTAPDARTRSRIRSRVFGTFRPRPATLLDRVAVVFDVLGRPAPYAMRGLGVVLAVACIAASTALVSSGTVADDALYSVKIASEQVRLALATSPEDRAIVELSIAEHRLAEATALVAAGNDDDALVATSEYGEHMANAAAELAQVESIEPDTATLVVQLQARIDEHRAAAAAAVARISYDPNRAPSAVVLAVIAGRGTTAAGDLSPAAAIAQDAADTADEAAAVAESRVAPTVAVEVDPSSDADDRDGITPKITPTTRSGQGGEHVSKKERAAEFARKAAEEAKAAAKKAKEGGRRKPRRP